MSELEYPIRAKIIDADGEKFGPGLVARTPEVSRPHIGKEGLAEKVYIEDEPDISTVKITLDDGTILYGFECWWEPII